LSDGECWKREVVGQELEALPRFHVEITHSAQLIRVSFNGVDGGQNDCVIGSNASSLVHQMRVSALDSEGWRSAFRTDVDHDSEVMPISVPN